MVGLSFKIKLFDITGIWRSNASSETLSPLASNASSDPCQLSRVSKMVLVLNKN